MNTTAQTCNVRTHAVTEVQSMRNCYCWHLLVLTLLGSSHSGGLRCALFLVNSRAEHADITKSSEESSHVQPPNASARVMNTTVTTCMKVVPAGLSLPRVTKQSLERVPDAHMPQLKLSSQCILTSICPCRNFVFGFHLTFDVPYNVDIYGR